MVNSSSLTFRQARALIRHKVREKLLPDLGQQIFQTHYFIERINLAGVAYSYLDARMPNGQTVSIEQLLDIVIAEFRDFVLVQDTESTVSVVTTLHCLSCHATYTSAAGLYCPNCTYPNFFQKANLELDDIQSSLDLDSNDPIARRILASTERLRLDNAYLKLVTCFEVFHRALNVYLCTKSGRTLLTPSNKNEFQNIGRAIDWFRIHHAYLIAQTWSSDEERKVRFSFQKRHVLTHTGGLIDENYCNNTGENRSLVGTPVQLNKDEIITAVQAVKKAMETTRQHFAPIP